MAKKIEIKTLALALDIVALNMPDGYARSAIKEASYRLLELEERIGELEGGCIMAAGFISGTLEDPEISGTYCYLTSVLNPLDPK